MYHDRLTLTFTLIGRKGLKRSTFALDVGRSTASIPAPHAHVWSPPSDLYETQCEIVIDVNLAGIQSSVVRIDMTPRIIKITGHRPHQQEPEPMSFHLMEIERGTFERILQLPVPTRPREAQVQYHDGLLTIRLPKINGGFYHACISGSNEDFE